MTIRTGPESLSTSALLDAPLEFLNGVEDLGTETVDGRTLRRQRGVMDLERWADGVAPEGTTDSSGEDLRRQFLAGTSGSGHLDLR